MSAAEDALTSAHQNFCGATEGYIETLDRYGRVFTDSSATVGDVQTLGADLVEPRDAVTTSAGAVKTAKNNLTTAQKELADAQAALAAAIATASGMPVELGTGEHGNDRDHHAGPPATIERVQLAEEDLARDGEEDQRRTPRSSTRARSTTRPRWPSRSRG